MVEDQRESLRAAQDRQTAEQLLTKTGNNSSDIVSALSLAEGAVAVHRRIGPPEECAASWYVLGLAWFAQDGERGENLERALDAMMFSLDLRGQVGPRDEWARVLANVGALYWHRAAGEQGQRSLGVRADDIERAIGAWRAAAAAFDVHASSHQAEQWVTATENLATGYLRRQVGERAQNVADAVAAIKGVAEFHRDRRQHSEWARTQNWLANTLIEHGSGDHVERAIEIFTGILHDTAGQTEDDVASTEVNLALAYMRQPRGDRQQHIARAMSYCRSALARNSPGDSRAVAQANGTLGAALVALEPRWDSANVEAAIEHLRTAAAMFHRIGPSKEHAITQFNLGQALWHRAVGDPDDNLEQALEAWLDAGRSATHAQVNDHEPAEFGSEIEAAVGIAYLQRSKGDRGDNIEHAIAAFWRATLPFPEDSQDPRLAVARHNLGSAYLERSTGDRAANLTRAREALEAARRVRTRQRSPLDWALTETTLGVAYAKLAEIGRGDVLADRAVEAHSGALEVLDPTLQATEWLRAQANLAAAYLARSHPGRLDDVDRAIAAFETVFTTVPALGGTSAEWFTACHGLGFAYLQRDQGRHGEDSRRAIKVWQTGLDRHAQTSLPRLRRATARALGDLLCEFGRWTEAADSYGVAVDAMNELYRASFLANSQRDELESGGDTFILAAYAMVRSDPGRASEALAMLEQGRARSLAEQLSRDGTEQAAARGGDPELHKSYAETLAGLREVEAVLQNGTAIPWLVSKFEGMPPDLVDDDRGRRVAERLLASMVSEAKERLDTLARQIGNAVADPGEPFAAPSLADLTAAAVPGVPVAFLACTPFGSIVLVLYVEMGTAAVDAVPVDDLDEAGLHRALGLSRGDHVGPPGYLLGQLGVESPMKPYVQSLLAGLGSRLIRPLAEWLAHHGATGVVLIPTGHLGLLPLHAVSVIDDPGGRCLLDDFDVAYAPSVGALRSARKAAHEREQVPRRLAGVADPTMDNHLRWARAELAEVARHFDEHEVHSGAAATKSALTGAAKGASYVHLACHGRYDLSAPLSSGLALADGMLTIGDVVRDRPFASARLVTASACQTAVTEFMRLPDEVFGLPAGFLAAGTPAVIGTLWPTDDLAAALVMARFYRLHLQEALPPAKALRGAQLWLRALTGEQLVTEIKSLSPTLTAFGVSDVLEVATDEPTTRFYDHPVYWAPFVIIGA
ncbi:CHAT domain-containing protein [Amycolatopsis sp. EV170708-02-1]|uniref:CHAT domain-containing protein n=1 Tax=Amycolatopsis sp. EV170708-02-1 TaxID=2919322 RepID=UPI001F0CA79B|nr:CHAT domain-containing protein [Amycolatopsis sp. EV170708-02-1]UMP07237.1 CHAT domain-containing protein [Amycolatopsis sp. EV170708-02-1]